MRIQDYDELGRYVTDTGADEILKHTLATRLEEYDVRDYGALDVNEMRLVLNEKTRGLFGYSLGDHVRDQVRDICEHLGRYDFLHGTLLDDELSRSVLFNLLAYRLSGNASHLLDAYCEGVQQYFDETVALFSEGCRYADCGGLDGKTTAEFILKCPSFEKAYVYEPIPRYYDECCRNTEGFNDGRIEVRQSAVLDRCATVRFDAGRNPGSGKVSPDGAIEVKAVRLDDDISEPLDFVKMDIEGSETLALAGAAGHIVRSTPMLAICAYHLPDDLWRLAHMIFERNGGYSFRLRHHTLQSEDETVLYAAPRDRSLRKRASRDSLPPQIEAGCLRLVQRIASDEMRELVRSKYYLLGQLANYQTLSATLSASLDETKSYSEELSSAKEWHRQRAEAMEQQVETWQQRAGVAESRADYHRRLLTLELARIAGLEEAASAAAALSSEKAAPIREIKELESVRRQAERGRTIRLLRGALIVLCAIAGGQNRRDRLRQLWLGIRIMLDREAFATWRRRFDAIWYLAKNPDVLMVGLPASLHYLLHGYLEGREVSREGGSQGYLKDNPDVAAAGLNPLAHYALCGLREGRTWPSPGLPETSAADHDGSRQPTVDRGEIRLNTVWPDELPLVSVVIPCFNYGGHLRESLETVLRQTWEDLEVIVIEGGSTDTESLDAVRRLEAEAPSRTKFLYRSERHLAGDNRNFGIGHARGRYVCCLDADDLLEAVYLEVAVFLAERFGYELVYPSVRCFGESEDVWLITDARFPEIARENGVSTVALFKRSLWAEVGGYRDWGLGDRHVPEDWEFWTRILGHGCRAMGIRAPLMKYRVHAGSLIHSATSSARFHAEQIHEANRSLIEQGRPARAVARNLEVRDGFCNIMAPRRASAATDAVLFALPFITVGGAEHLLATLGKDLVDRGRRLIVTTSDELPSTMPSVPELFRQVTPHVYDLAGLFSDDEHRSEYVHYLVERYQVGTLLLVGSRFVYNLLPKLRARRPRMAVVDHLFNDVGHLDANRQFQEQIDLTIVPSEALKDVLVSGHGEDSARVVVIQHGINLRESVAAPTGNLPVDWRPGVPTVAFFGRMSEEKGPLSFVRIARDLAGEMQVNFVMTGEGPLKDEVRSLIRDAGLEDRFFTPGFVADVRPLMLRADVVVIPSLVDGLPLVALESLALGKPVVASAVGSLPEVVRDGETGFLCSSGNIEAFSERIRELLSDPALRYQLGEAGRRLIRSEYGSDRMAERYVRAFDKARSVASRG